MAGVAGNLADVIHVVDHRFERDAKRLWSRFSPHPARHQHPRIERRPDNRPTADQLADLIVRELPVVRDERPAIRVTGPHSALEMIEGFPKTVVAEVRHIKDDSKPLHLAKKLTSTDADSTRRIRALGVDARSVVGRTDGSQTVRISPLEMVERDDRVRAFETQDIADRDSTRAAAPRIQMRVETFTITNLRHVAP